MDVNYTQRLDLAIRRSAWAHEQAKQHRKGTDIPYIIHPYGTMLIASNATNDEDTLIACLLHDILEDVNPKIYGEEQIVNDFGDDVLSIVKDVTNNGSPDWYDRSSSYLDHLQNKASDKAVVVSMADKIHNISSVLFDLDMIGDKLWERFSTKNSKDQVWWYESILNVTLKRQAPKLLTDQLTDLITQLKSKVN